MKIYIRLEAPFEWVRVNAKQIDAFGEVSALSDYPISDDDDVIGVVPGEWVTSHRITLPAKTRKQFNAALPYALEEALSEDVEDMHFVCPSWKAGEECIVLSVAKARLQNWQTLAEDNRLPVGRLLPDYALIPFHDIAEFSIASSGEELLASEQDGFGVSLDQDFLDAWIIDVPMASTIAVNDETLVEELISEYPDRDFRLWNFGYKMAHWLEHSPTFNYDLWADKYRPAVSRGRGRAFVIPLAILGFAIFGKFAFDTYRYLALHAETAKVRAEAQVLVKETFPEAGPVPVGSEKQVMLRGLENLGSTGPAATLQTMLSETASVLKQNNVTISNLVFRDSKLVITCQVSDFSQVDILTRQLNARRGLSAALQGSSSDDGNISASYSITQG